MRARKIAIAGRGLAGLSLALRMAKAGLQPILFGRRASPDNASRCAQGIVCNKGLIFAESPLFRAKLQALRVLPAWLSELEILSGQAIPRHLNGVEEPYWDELDFQKTLRRVYRGNFWGCYGASHLASLHWRKCPFMVRSPLGYLNYPADGWFDVSASLDALERASQRLGVQQIDDDIQDLQFSPGGLSFRTSGQVWSFEHLVIAAGQASMPLLTQLGLVPPKYFLIAGQSLSLALPPGQNQRTMVKGNLSLAISFDRMIIGSSSWKAEDSAYDRRLDQRQLLQSAAIAFGLDFALLEKQPWQAHWGVRLRVSDRMPILGIWPEQAAQQRISVLTGLYKNGLQLADLCAEELFKELQGQELGEFGQAFHVRRLMQKKAL